MSPRFWIFVAGLLGATAVIAGAIGAHAVPRGDAAFAVLGRIFDAAQLYHALHAIALVGVAAVMAGTEGKRTAWAGGLLQVAALGFVLGIAMFSGGIYVQLGQGLASSGGIVPVGGIAFIVGWVAFALSALGMRR
jgi:uncharacterized membrane protein YgdD (TMEM256/DUF423 family)